MRTASRIIAHSLALFVAAVAVSPNVRAQSARVGYIDEVRGVASPQNQGCDRTFALPGSRNWLSISRGSFEVPAWQKDSVLLRDRLWVRYPADVRVRASSERFGDGTIYLAPGLGKCAEVALRDSAEGSYLITSGSEGGHSAQIERLILSIENGAAYVQWSRGSLSVVALGREIQATGAEFAVLADSTTNRALLYVHQGVVTMPDAAELQAVAGTAFMIHREGRPEAFTLNSDFVRDAMYHARVVWTQDTQTSERVASNGIPTSTFLAVAVIVIAVAVVVAEFSAKDWQCVSGCDASGWTWTSIASRSLASAGMSVVSPGARVTGRAQPARSIRR